MNTTKRAKASTSALPADLIADLAAVDSYAVTQLANFEGPGIFNPLIGDTPSETFGNLEQVLGLLHNLLEQDFQAENGMGGIVLLTQSAWAAAQYEAFRVKEAEAVA